MYKLIIFLIFMTSSLSAIHETIGIYHHPDYGDILTDNRGITLYTSRNDKINESTCYDLCLVNFRPYNIQYGQVRAPEGFFGSLTAIKRKDNQRQVAYNGKPLYTYIEDKIPGDVNGQGFDNQWFIISFYPPEESNGE